MKPRLLAATAYALALIVPPAGMTPILRATDRYRMAGRCDKRLQVTASRLEPGGTAGCKKKPGQAAASYSRLSTSSVTTAKRVSHALPNCVEIATSAASRPRAITTHRKCSKKFRMTALGSATKSNTWRARRSQGPVCVQSEICLSRMPERKSDKSSEDLRREVTG
jgi:hypothetical protein